MQILCASFNYLGTDFIVFDADHPSRLDSERAQLLTRLRTVATTCGFKTDLAALAFRENDQNRFYGSPELVEFLAKTGLPGWTHRLTLEHTVAPTFVSTSDPREP